MVVSRGRPGGPLARLAAGAEVPVFVARGLGAGDTEARLLGTSAVRVVASPRQATVLVVAGHVPPGMAEPLARVHDQIPPPRVTVWRTGAGAGALDAIRAAWPQATVVGPGDDVAATVVHAYREVLLGRRPTEQPRLADVEPAEWRGVGPYGQGGSGMTGGVPYGRPMAGRADDLRDGLSLDVVRVRMGPFLPAFPTGLVLAVTFAGDVVHAVEVDDLLTPGDGGLGAPLPDDAADSRGDPAARPVRIDGLERARCRHHLRWLARLLRLYGLEALGRRVALMAAAPVPEDIAHLRNLHRRLERAWVLGRVTAGVGVVTGDAAAQWGGVTARAAGLAVDARSGSPAYQALGFAPVTHEAGDGRDRWRQRLAEATQALELAGRAGDATVDDDHIEPAGQPAPADLAGALGTALTGQEWGDALATVASIDPVVHPGAGADRPARAEAAA
ncbi:MAG: hypothetical protein HYX34_00945 [Actinobacteria bacterium]|nr:hypothetical protein [Actinomycetota bacterium]